MKTLLALSLMMSSIAFAGEEQEIAQEEQQVAVKKVLVLEEGAEEVAQEEAQACEAAE
jgi:hypothetical protein